MVTKISDFLNTTFSTLTLNDAINNSVVYPGTIVHTTTGTPGTGIGAGLQFQVETSNDNNEMGMSLETVTTDVTAGSEDFDFVVKLMQNGAAAGERLRLNSAGQLTSLAGMVATSFTPNGSTVPTNGMYLPTTNTVGFSTGAADRMRIDASGNVGIGTATSTARLTVQGGGTMFAGWTRSLALNATYPVAVFNSSGLKYSAIGTDYSVPSAGFVFWTNGSTEDVSGTGTIAMKISHLGNVTVGDTAVEPASKFQVISTAGAAPVNTTGSGAVRIRSTATAGVGVGPSIIFEGQTNNTTSNYGFSAIQGFKSSATAADYSGGLAFYTQNSGGSTAFDERMRIDAPGNVSIGTTSVFYPSGGRTTLSLNGTSMAIMGFGTGGTQRGYVYHDGTSMYFNADTGSIYIGPTGSNLLYMQTSNVDRMRITSAGNVTIGTPGVTTPAGLLVVSNYNNSALPLAALDASTLVVRNDSVTSLNVTSKLNFNVASIGSSVVAGYYAAFNAANDIGTGLIFGTQTNAAGGTVERMRIDANGRVGIATTSPGSPLDVNGNASFRSAISTVSTATVSSLVSNGAISGTTGTFSSALYSASFNTAGTATVNSLVSNGAVSGTTMTGTVGTFTSIQNSGNERSANIVSNTWIHATQNLTVASSNISTTTGTGALVVTGGAGIGSNIYAGGNVVAASFQPTSASVPGVGIYLPTTNTLAVSTTGAERMRIDSAGNVGIGTSTIQTGYKLQVEGDFAATSKSFVIYHPTKPGKMLRYGSLESPYHGIRLTGEAEVVDGKCTVDLPDYISGLCHQEGAQVQITNIKHGKTLWIEDIDVSANSFVVATRGKTGRYRFYWSFTAVRKDIEDMVVEFDKQ